MEFSSCAGSREPFVITMTATDSQKLWTEQFNYHSSFFLESILWVAVEPIYPKNSFQSSFWGKMRMVRQWQPYVYARRLGWGTEILDGGSLDSQNYEDSDQYEVDRILQICFFSAFAFLFL